MKHALLAATAILALTTTAQADGFTYHGATFDGQIIGNFGDFGSTTRTGKTASAQYDFNGTNYFMQPEISLNSYNFAKFSGSVGSHVGLNLNADTALGGFVTYTGALPGFFSTGDVAFGPEIKGAFGAFTYEAYAGLFANGGGVYGGTVRADVWRPINDRFSIGGGLGALYAGGPTYLQGSLRACYDITDSLDLEGSYTLSTDGTNMNHGIGVKLTYKLDGGTTFSPRDYVSLRMGF